MRAARTKIKRVSGLDNDRGIVSRRPRRLHLKQECLVHPFQAQAVVALLEDVSLRGFRLSCRSFLLVGSQLVLEIPGLGQVAAQVRWALGGEAGGIFLSRIDEDAFQRWVGVRRRELVGEE